MVHFDVNWLCRPIAHRGFHNNDNGVIENSASAIEAAIHRNYAIEVDLQASAEYEPVVFHDNVLERLTDENGRVAMRPVSDLKSIQYRNSSDTILTLSDLLHLVDGQVPLLIEIKGTKHTAREFGCRVGEIIKDYPGHIAIMSFKPELVESCLETAPDLPRGLTISYLGMPMARMWKFIAMYINIGRHIKPQFVAYDVRTLPGLTPFLLRRVFGMKLLAWTVRKRKQQAKASKWADAMIFEGFEV